MARRIEFALGRSTTLGTFFDALSAVYGDRPFGQEDGVGGLSLTYAGAAETIRRWSAALSRDLRPGDRVIVAAPNGYSVLMLAIAVSRAGGVAVPVNAQAPEEEVQRVAADCSPVRIIRDPSELDGAGDDAAEHAPAMAAPDDVAALFYTSGTTGPPKGAHLTHRALVGRFRALVLYPSWIHRDEAIVATPVAHIAGFSAVSLFATIGIPTYLLRHFRPDVALDTIARRRTTIFLGVPTMYRMMEEAGPEQRDLSSMRMWAAGAEAVSDELVKRFQARGATFGTRALRRTFGKAAFIDGYGMVEVAGGALIRFYPPGPRASSTSCIAVRMPGVRLRVVDDAGQRVGRGKVGELVVSGPAVMRGYEGRSDESRSRLTDDGWLHTGDLVRRSLVRTEFVGRTKDVVKHGGFSVSAVEVEHVLAEHPDVAEVAVVAIPDALKGEIPGAVVRMLAGRDLDHDALIAFAAERLAPYKVPVRVVAIDDFPRNPTGKIQKGDLPMLFESVGVAAEPPKR